MAEHFTLSVDGAGIARLLFDTPGEKVNTFGEAALRELDATLGEIERRSSSGEIRALALLSAKRGNFIAGADIHLIQAIDQADEARRASTAGQELFSRLQDLPVPTMAVINGSCVGGGLEYALACDTRIAASGEKTKIGLPETQLGIIPGWGGTFRLPRIVGWEQAVRLITAGSTVDADRALRIGLVDAVYPETFLEEWSLKLLAELAAGGGIRAAAAHPRIAAARAKARKRRKWLLERTALGRHLVFRTARKTARKRTGGHYPAPLAALDVMARTTRGSLTDRRWRARAMRIESAEFARLAITDVCKNLTGIFFAREAAKRHPARRAARDDWQLERAAVLGAGVMGGRIAWLLSNAEISVTMKDIAWDAVQKGYQSAREVYDGLVARRKLERREAALRMNRIHGAVDYASLGAPQLVVEAVVERMDVKKSVLAELEPLLDGDAIIATNTSALSIGDMASVLTRPGRFVGMHFFNPVDRMPLVEVIRGPATTDGAVGDVYALALRLGKTPVVVRDSPGFLVNRLLLPYLNEAALMLSEGIDYVHVDRLYVEFGLPMGPYTLLDEVGIDVGFHVAQTLHEAFGARMATAPILDRVRERSDLFGRKAGAGFYRYDGRSRGEPNGAMQQVIGDVRDRSVVKPDDRDALDRGLLNMVNEAAYALEEEVVGSAEELDLAMILGTGFPPFRGGLLRWADRVGTRAIRARLEELAARYGNRFVPAPMLVTLAEAGRGFYDRAD